MSEAKTDDNEYAERVSDLRDILRFQARYLSEENLGGLFKNSIRLAGLSLLSKNLVPEFIKDRLPLFYQPQDVRMQDLRDRLSLTEDGKKLLDFTDKNGIKISQKDYDGIMEGFVSSDGPVTTITLRADLDSVKKTNILFHELRHIEQMAIVDAAKGMKYFTRTPDSSPTVDAINGKIYEADAFTFGTMQAIRLDKMGHPEYLRQIMEAPVSRKSAPGVMQSYLLENYANNYKDEHSFARGLFNEVITKGLEYYEMLYTREAMYGRFDYQSRTLNDFRTEMQSQAPKAPLADDELHRMTQLGEKSYLSGVSMNALCTGIVSGMNPKHISILSTKEQMIDRAANLTPQEMTALQDKMQGTYISTLKPASLGMRIRANIRTGVKEFFKDLSQKVGEKIDQWENRKKPKPETPKNDICRMPTDIEDRLGPPSTFGKTAEKPTASPAPQAIAAVTVKRTKTL